MRLFRPLAVAVALSVLAGRAAPARAETLTDLGKRLGELRKRVSLWLHLVSQDPERDKITLYLKQTDEDFKKKAPDLVTAKMLVDILSNKDQKDLKIRNEAGEALKKSTEIGLDPDLQPRKKKGIISERAQFAIAHLIPLLTKSDKKDGDRWTREIASGILSKWFSASGSNQTAIGLYNSTNEATWARAAAAWKDVAKDF